MFDWGGMSIRVVGSDSKEIDLMAWRQPLREIHSFELGFHEAVLEKTLDDNPFPSHTSAAEEWDSGWKVYNNRKKNMKWLTLKDCTPDGADGNSESNWLCLVKDRDGYFLHKPCTPKFVGLELKLVWIDYHGQVVVDVVEFAHVSMKNPRFINAMQANQNWTAVGSSDQGEQ